MKLQWTSCINSAMSCAAGPARANTRTESFPFGLIVSGFYSIEGLRTLIDLRREIGDNESLIS